MENVWVSIGEQWGVENTKGKDGDARIRGGGGPKRAMRGILPKAMGYSHGGVTPTPHEEENAQTQAEG